MAIRTPKLNVPDSHTESIEARYAINAFHLVPIIIRPQTRACNSGGKVPWLVQSIQYPELSRTPRIRHFSPFTDWPPLKTLLASMSWCVSVGAGGRWSEHAEKWERRSLQTFPVYCDPVMLSFQLKRPAY
jgi:hypothetical protein